MDKNLHSVQIQIERKHLAFDLKENQQGLFLRITEEVGSGRRNAIVIPATGLELFRDSLNEMIRLKRTPAGGEAVLSLGRAKAESPPPTNDPVDLRRGP